MYDMEVINNNKIGTQINSNLIEGFIDFLDVSDNTAKTYKKAIRQLFTYFGANGISKPTRSDVITFKKDLQDKGRKPSTINLYLSATRRFFSWTEQSGIYPHIARDVKAPKLNRGHKKDYFTGSQVKSILSGIDRSDHEEMRNFAIMALMTTGGLRTVEVIRARIEDLRVVGDTPVLYIQGKGRCEKTDFVKLCPQVEEAIRAYLKLRGKVASTEALFTSESKRNRGQELTTRSIRGICKNAMINAGFNSNRLTAHSLRHTAVTLALLGGQSLQEVQHFARHNNISTTQIYAHNLDRMKSHCEQTISNAIF